MNILSPKIPGGWGDKIIPIWASEYIKHHLPHCKIYDTDRVFVGGQIKEDWFSGTRGDVLNSDINNVDYVLFTHHRHLAGFLDYYYAEFENYKKIFFDAHAIYIKFIKENWYPTFVPNDDIKQIVEQLNLPSEYNVVHHASSSSRNIYSPQDWRKKYPKVFELNNLFSTGERIEGVTDLSHLPPWAKLYIMINAKNLYVSQSGFTSIAAIYRKRVNTYLLGLDFDNLTLHLQQAPPIQAYGNIEFDYNQKKAFYFMEKAKIVDYYQYCRSIHPTLNNSPDNEVFPMFYGDATNYKESFVPQTIYFNQENAPVTDLTTKINDVDFL